MAYETPITVKSAMNAIADREYVLPSIQREFVWTTEQIEMLFDSLMRDYPISTFLFWKVKAENITKFKFYSFLRNYHERDERHNNETSLSGKESVIAVLDGQQRLTSIYLALYGTFSSRLRYHRTTSDLAYPKKNLYLNLLKESDDISKEYDFKFLPEENGKVRDFQNFWVKVGKVLDFEEYEDASDWVNDQLEDFSDVLETPLDKEVRKAARRRLCTLYRVVCERKSLSFYLEKSDELDKVLQIFIRINQGGTELSYSDLLLSIATAQWQTLDARKEIHEFVDKINNMGKGFNFNKDFVLKSCLVLADLKDIAFNVDNFSSENMKLIEEQWEGISQAVSLAVRLVAHFGFEEKTLKSTNAIIPISYFLKNKGIGEEILHSGSHDENRKAIKEWLVRALLRRHFGGQPDSLYPIYRKKINEGGLTFPLPTLIEHFSATRTLEFYDDDVENLLSTVKYGSADAFMLLSLICPVDHNYEFHQDHIHPKKYFTSIRLEKLGVDSVEQREEYLKRFDLLPNLQLLQATPNIEKGAKMLDEWVAENKSDEGELRQYKDLHFFPTEKSLRFANFLDFFESRKELLRSRIHHLLNVKRTTKEDGGDGVSEVVVEDRNPPANWHADCISEIQRAKEVSLIREGRSQVYETENGQLTIMCAVSKWYGEDSRYWFSIFPRQIEALKNRHEPVVAFGCGDASRIFLVPSDLIFSKLDFLNKTTQNDGEDYWHIYIYPKPKWVIKTKPDFNDIDIESYRI
jgi:uncharacterized protein with ParB-like and HNH nuclease domain